MIPAALDSFCPDGPQVPLAIITPATHPLPTNFSNVLLACEGWTEETDLFPDPQRTCPSSDDTYLSLWCPDDSPLPSPDHSITICNQHPESDYPAHGASFVSVDWHHRTPDGRWVWECAHSHLPHCTHLSGLFPHLHSLWASFFHDGETDLTAFSDIAAAAYLDYVGQPRPGVAAWRFPPHSLATNTLTLLLKIFTTPAVLIEGFGAGCSFAAVAGLLTMDHTCYPNTRRSSVLLSLGGVAIHPPTFSSLVDAYAFHHSQDAQKYHAYIDEERPDLPTRPADFQPNENTELTYGFLIVQHVHDRKAPWTLSPLLLSHLHNKGISVLTLHDDVEAQREKAAKMDQDLVLTSPFGHYRHHYEDVVPTLKTFGATTFFTNFLRPLTYDQLEAREGAVGTTYSSDLLDLLLAFLSFHGTLARPFFQATPEALEQVLAQGCYRHPGPLLGLFHISPELHECPVDFYTRAFILPLRFPTLLTLGIPLPDIYAMEAALCQTLLRLPLAQALDFLHTQLLSALCTSAPRRANKDAPIHTDEPSLPTACYLHFPPRTTIHPEPPQFRCWVTRRVSPNMAVVCLKCNSVAWAHSYTNGTSGNPFLGFTPGNFLQLAFPTERFPCKKASHFAIALYILSTSGHKGPVGEELPTEQRDAGPTYVSAITGILLPFLLRPELRPGHVATSPEAALFQLGLPLFPRDGDLVQALELPPLSMDHSFYMPISSIRDISRRLLQVPFYRQPNTLGWPFMDCPVPPIDATARPVPYRSLSCIPLMPSLISSPMGSDLARTLPTWNYLMTGPLSGTSLFPRTLQSSRPYKAHILMLSLFYGPSEDTF